MWLHNLTNCCPNLFSDLTSKQFSRRIFGQPARKDYWVTPSNLGGSTMLRIHTLIVGLTSQWYYTIIQNSLYYTKGTTKFYYFYYTGRWTSWLGMWLRICYVYLYTRNKALSAARRLLTRRRFVTDLTCYMSVGSRCELTRARIYCCTDSMNCTRIYRLHSMVMTDTGRL